MRQLLVVEATDVVFAVDSIPAVIGIFPPELSPESKNFLAFTSNIFAILGLRSMFFAISGFMKYFRFLKIGLAFILVFIGGKMIAATCDPALHVPTDLSLAMPSRRARARRRRLGDLPRKRKNARDAGGHRAA